MEMDTDVLLALVASSLPAGILATEAELLDALIEACGDVSQAAEYIRSKDQSKNLRPGPKKRKLSGGLDAWLRSSRARTHLHTDSSGEASGSRGKRQSGSPSDPSPTKATSPSKPIPPPSGDERGHASSLLSLLRAPSTSPKKSSLPRLSVLTLTTPSMIAQYTPTTLHTSILPAGECLLSMEPTRHTSCFVIYVELACQLYYTMLEEAETWSRSKYYLAGRLVESPHTSGFYARDPKAATTKRMLEAARYWFSQAPLCCLGYL